MKAQEMEAFEPSFSFSYFVSAYAGLMVADVLIWTVVVKK